MSYPDNGEPRVPTWWGELGVYALAWGVCAVACAALGGAVAMVGGGLGLFITGP